MGYMKKKNSIKRVISQKVVLHDTPEGKRNSFVDIFSAIKKNNKKTKMVRHMRKNKDKSTILVKSDNGKKYKVITANKNHKMKKYVIKNAELIKKIFRKQRHNLVNNEQNNNKNNEQNNNRNNNQ